MSALAHPRSFKHGRVYAHPEQGHIQIKSGYFLDPVYQRLSNHWHWTVLETGETGHGYGGEWEDVTDQYVTFSVPRHWLRLAGLDQITEREENPS